MFHLLEKSLSLLTELFQLYRIISHGRFVYIRFFQFLSIISITIYLWTSNLWSAANGIYLLSRTVSGQPQEVMGCFLGPFGNPSFPYTHIHKILFSFQCFLFDILRSSELVWWVLLSSSRITYSLRFLYQNVLPSWRTLSGIDIRSLYSHFSLRWPSVRTINKVFLWQTYF